MSSAGATSAYDKFEEVREMFTMFEIWIFIFQKYIFFFYFNPQIQVLLPFILDRQSGILSYLVESFSGARLFAEYKSQKVVTPWPWRSIGQPIKARHYVMHVLFSILVLRKKLLKVKKELSL